MNPDFYLLPLHERLKKLVDEKWSHLGHGYRKKAAEEMGISQTQISKTLKGRHRPTDEILQKMADGIGISPDLILGTSVQVVGVVSAGGGIDDATKPYDELATGKLCPPGTVGYLVHGDSMEDARVFPGDHILVRREPQPAVGEIVVVYHPAKNGTLVKLKQSKNYESLNERHPHAPIPWVDGCREYGVLIYVVREVKPTRRAKRGKS